MTASEIIASAAKSKSTLQALSKEQISKILSSVADDIDAQTDKLLAANAADVATMDESNPMRDRLLLTPERVRSITADMRRVAQLPSPIGEIMASWTRPNGLKIEKRRVPFGVIGVIYEARPNVTFDVFGLCFKTQNCVILKGGHEAALSNATAVEIIHNSLATQGIDENCVQLLDNSRESTAELLTARGNVDLIIPRGSSRLIEYVRTNATVPIIETGAGVVHLYFDATGKTDIGTATVFNSKTRRVSVCNALDCLIIHASRLGDLAKICSPLASRNVMLYADTDAYKALEGLYPDQLLKTADNNSFGTEFLDYKMAIKTVPNIDEALKHIAKYSSGHSEAIITEDKTAAECFEAQVDSACVYVNAATSFTDGGEFGFGAEIGISTQKMHARGPMGLPEITTYKYIITGNGQTR